MSPTISFAQAAVYQFAKIHRQYFNFSDVARETGVTELTCYRHCIAFLELGIFHNEFYGPQQVFKFAPQQSPKPDLVRRLEAALPNIFAQRAQGAALAKRHMRKMAKWPGSQRANPGYTKPGGRRSPSDPAKRT